MSDTIKLSKPIYEIMQDIATKYNITIPKDDYEVILWTATGYPCFWRGDPEKCFRSQLNIFFKKAAKSSIHKTIDAYEEEMMNQLKALRKKSKKD